MNETGSEVVSTLQQAAELAWKRWRAQVAAGKGESAEAAKAYEDARLANATYVGELVDRAALGSR